MNETPMDVRMENFDRRIASLEEWRRRKDIDFARDDERSKYLTERFDKIDKEISDMKGGVTKLMWAMVTAIAVGVVNFIIQGGLTNVIPN